MTALPHDTPRLTAAGIGRLATVLVSIALLAALFFVAAGTLDAPRAWLLYGGILVYMLVALIVMLVRFPGVAELVNERGKLHADARRWDKAFGVAYTVLLLGQPVLAGLDAVRFQWTSAPPALAGPAVAVTIAAYMLGHWTMIVNRHAETLVRVQEERQHQVVSTGPYRFVRHPMYVSILAAQLVYPLAVGSLWAYAPAFAIVALMVWRTAREDTYLRAELPGYADYAQKTRARLVPGAW